MMELPESFALSKQLEEVVLGRCVSQIVVGSSPHKFAFFSENREVYDRLCDKRIDQVRPVGGQLEFTIGEYHLLIGDGVSNRFLSAEEPTPAKHHLLIGFHDGSKLVMTVQMYGFMLAAPKGELDSFYYTVALEKPSPLTEEFTWEYFTDLIESTKPSLSIKALLATEQRIPGLGNGVLQDILFHARIHPQTKRSALGEEQLRGLFESVKKTLEKMAQQGGRNTEKDIYGNAGGYQTILSNKTSKEPCPICGGSITKKAYLGGTVYFCENCQPLQ